jgi:hypothetical protein
MNGAVSRCSPFARSKQKEESIAACLCEKLTLSAFELGVEQDGRLYSIPVMGVVRRNLIAPRHLSRIDVQRDDGAGPEMSPSRLACVYGIWIAGTPVNEVQVGIVSAGHPCHAAAVVASLRIGPGLSAGLPCFGLCVPMPSDFSGLGITRFEITRIV